jgi:hypothetical protein
MSQAPRPFRLRCRLVVDRHAAVRQMRRLDEQGQALSDLSKENALGIVVRLELSYEPELR